MDWKRNEANVVPVPSLPEGRQVARFDFYGTGKRGDVATRRRLLSLKVRTRQTSTVEVNAKGEEATRTTVDRYVDGGTLTPTSLTLPAMDWPAKDWTAVEVMAEDDAGNRYELGTFTAS